jgi:membrane protease subunit HflK
MPWQNQGGGGGPWGGSGGGGGQGPWGRGPGQRPPDIEDLLNRVKRFSPGGFGGGRGIALFGVGIVVVWLMTGFYTVQPDEVGVPLLFGKVQGTTQPGFNWNWPSPIGHVEKPKVTAVNRIEIGGRSDGNASDSVLAESLMLTGDENIIDIRFNVQWQINDPYKYLFNINDPEGTIKSVSEAAMREIIGQTQFQYALTEGRAEVEFRSKELIQAILNTYGAGVFVTQVALQGVDPPGQVVEAFRDVQAAKADKESAVNEAQKYFNQVTQEAEGNAQQIIKAAEGYKEQKIAISTGDAQRFIAVYDQYVQSKTITERRIYLETMEQIMRNMDKVLIDGAGMGGAVPYLPLNELLKNSVPGRVGQTIGEGSAPGTAATGASQ